VEKGIDESINRMAPEDRKPMIKFLLIQRVRRSEDREAECDKNESFRR
jgi:hypothetical protein